MLPKLVDIQVPTLVISGRGDWITPVVEGGQRIHDALPNSEFVIFEKSGHYPFVEEREEFFKVFKDWLKKQ
jgi:proline iminopeptidase